MCAGVLTLCCASAPHSQAVSQSARFSAQDAAAFQGDQNSLTNAIRDIQHSTGGTVVEIRFAQQNAKPGFHSVVAQNGQVQFARLEPPSKTLTQVTSRPDWMLKWEQKTDVSLATNAKVTLSQAILTAEAQNQGAPAVAAGIARSASDPNTKIHAYNVLLDDHGSTKRVAVDSSNGEIISDPGGLEDWP